MPNKILYSLSFLGLMMKNIFYSILFYFNFICNKIENNLPFFFWESKDLFSNIGDTFKNYIFFSKMHPFSVWWWRIHFILCFFFVIKLQVIFPPPFFLACCGSKHDSSRRVLYACDRQDEERTTTSNPLDNDANHDDNDDNDDDDDGDNDLSNGEDKKENAGDVGPGEEDLEAVASLLASRLHVADRRWEAGLRDRCVIFP